MVDQLLDVLFAKKVVFKIHSNKKVYFYNLYFNYFWGTEANFKILRLNHGEPYGSPYRMLYTIGKEKIKGMKDHVKSYPW